MKKIFIILLMISVNAYANLAGGIRPLSVYNGLYLRLDGTNASSVTGNIDIGAYDILCDVLNAETAAIGGATNYTSFGVDGTITFNGTAGIVIPHLMQSDTTDQAIVNVTLAQVITFNTDVHHNGITKTSTSRFTIAKEGSYLITFSGMAVGVTGKVIQFWLKKNAAYVDNSNTQYTFKGIGTNTVIACSFIEHFVVGNYFEFWTWGDDVLCKWDAIAAGTDPTRPAIPSIVITCNYLGKD